MSVLPSVSISFSVRLSLFLPSFLPSKGARSDKTDPCQGTPFPHPVRGEEALGRCSPPVVGLSLSICLRLPPSTVVRLRFGPVSVPVSVPDSFRQDRVLREFARYTDLKSRSCLQPQILLTLPYLGEPHWVQPSPSALKLHFSSTQKCPR